MLSIVYKFVLQLVLCSETSLLRRFKLLLFSSRDQDACSQSESQDSVSGEPVVNRKRNQEREEDPNLECFEQPVVIQEEKEFLLLFKSRLDSSAFVWLEHNIPDSLDDEACSRVLLEVL
jgi:hypothetical protein